MKKREVLTELRIIRNILFEIYERFYSDTNFDNSNIQLDEFEQIAKEEVYGKSH